MRAASAALILLSVSAFAQITGEVVYHRQMEGDGLLPRDVVVWLPPSYAAETNGAYSVLYMHDGQNIFDPATSFLGVDWGVDETATRLIQEGKIEEIIVVGMYNTANRSPEYGADAVKTKAYMEFVVRKVKPFVDAHYRTKPDRAHTATMGSSMGGLISFLLAWEYPETFSAAGCVSPAFIAGNWVDQADAYAGSPRNIRIYMDNGGVGLETNLQAGCDRMLEILPRKGITPEWFKDDNAEHNEPAWAARLHRPLLFLYGTERH